MNTRWSLSLLSVLTVFSFFLLFVASVPTESPRLSNEEIKKKVHEHVAHAHATRERLRLPGTIYAHPEEVVVHYYGLGHHCDPRESVQNSIHHRSGICRATLHCDPDTRLCDCADLEPYIFTAQNNTCKNIVGSACHETGDCVDHAECKDLICVCKPESECLKEKTKAKPLKPEQNLI